MTKNLNNEQRCKKDLILEYKKQHPEKTYQQIADDLHCGKNTVRKWVSKMNKEAGMPGKIQTCNGTWVEDITGQHFNMVTPICITQNKDCRNRWLWKCSCDCGKIFYASASDLKEERVISCGCTTNVSYHNLLGQRFGELTVISKTEERKDRHIVWECLCDCGQIIKVSSNDLIHGRKKRCNNHIRNDLTGKRSGKLVALSQTEQRRGSNIVWKCICDCGNICYVDSGRFYSRFSCGCLLSKGEQKVQSILQKLNINFVTQYTFPDCINPKTNRHLKFDFYLSKYNLCIEYDGVQHYYYTNSGWNTEEHFKDVKYRDSIKNKFCEDNNINLIRIPYTDYDKIDEQYILDILKPFENQTKDGDANDSAAI